MKYAYEETLHIDDTFSLRVRGIRKSGTRGAVTVEFNGGAVTLGLTGPEAVDLADHIARAARAADPDCVV